MSEWDARSANAPQSTLDPAAGPCGEGHGPRGSAPFGTPHAKTKAGDELRPQPTGARAFQRVSLPGGPTTCASVLLGTTTAMVVAGLTVRLHRIFVRRIDTNSTVIFDIDFSTGFLGY